MSSDGHSINTFSHPHSKPFTSNTNSKSSYAMPRTWHRAARVSRIRLTPVFVCPAVCGSHQTGIFLVKSLQAWTRCDEAFFVEHSLIDKTRIQHTQFVWQIQTCFGIISFTQVLCTIRSFCMHQAHNHQCFRTHLSVQHFHL